MGLLDIWAIRLTIICVAVFLLQLAIPQLTDALSLVSADVPVTPWTLVTAIFAHGSFEHLFYNMFALALFGSILEQIIGGRRFLALFFAAGIIAGLATLPFYPASLGASGAIFGLLGALAALRPRMTVWVVAVPMPMIVAAGVWAAMDLVGMFAPSGIANAAHLAGLGFGIVAGLLWRKRFGEQAIIRRIRGGDVSEAEFRRWEKNWLTLHRA